IDFGIVVDAPLDPEEPVPPLSGTRGYMAPECIHRGARPTAASDLYALGVTLFRLKTGRLPELTDRGVPSPLSLRSFVDDRAEDNTLEVQSLAALIDLLLEPDPGDRPCHADWVARALGHVRTRLDANRSVPEVHRHPSASSPAVEALLAFEQRMPTPLEPFF